MLSVGQFTGPHAEPPGWGGVRVSDTPYSLGATWGLGHFLCLGFRVRLPHSMLPIRGVPELADAQSSLAWQPETPMSGLAGLVNG